MMKKHERYGILGDSDSPQGRHEFLGHASNIEEARRIVEKDKERRKLLGLD